MKTAKKWFAASMLAFALAIPVGNVGAEQTTPMQPMNATSTQMKSTPMNMTMELVPLRKTAEMLGYEVMWNGMDHTVIITNKDMKKLMIMIGSKKVKVDMEEKMTMYAPIIQNGQTMVTKDFVDTFLQPMKK